MCLLFQSENANWFEEKNANETIVCFFWCYFTIVLDFLRKTERKICHKFTWARRHHFRQRARLNPQWRQYRKIAWCFLHFFCETAKCQNQCHLTKAKFTSKLKEYQNKHCFSLNQSQDFSAYRMISLKGAILGQVLLEFRFLIWILL